MKKFFFVLVLFTLGKLQALPVLNPTDPTLYTNNYWWDHDYYYCKYDSWVDRFSLHFGFYGDYVYNRKLGIDTKLEVIDGVTFSLGGGFIETTLATNAGILALDICHWIEIYGTCGVTNLFSKWNTTEFGGILNETVVDFNFNPEVSYTAGVSVALWECGSFTIGGQGQYFYCNPYLTSVTYYENGSKTNFDHNNRCTYQEYQGAVAAAYTFSTRNFAFIPFGAVDFSGVNWNLNNLVELVLEEEVPNFATAHQERITGWAIGITALLCDLASVTVEGRFANEKALHVNGQLAF